MIEFITNAVIIFAASFGLGLLIVYVAHYRKIVGHNNKYFTEKEMGTFNQHGHASFASGNEDYSRQLSHLD